LTELLSHILFQKYIYILALEMASPWNQHCASCIGTLSFRVKSDATFILLQHLFYFILFYMCERLD